MHSIRLVVFATLLASATPANATPTNTTDVRSRVVVETEGARYRLDHRLGGGWSGKTYLGHDEVTGAPVAIKIHSKSWFTRGHQETLEKEATILADLGNEPAFGHSLGMANVTAAGKPIRRALVMELAKGRDLWWGVDKHGMDPVRATTIAVDILQAVGRLHARGFRHNDLHPGNVLYDEATGKVTVLDLGNATKITEEFRIANDKYGAPEQTKRSKAPTAGGVTVDTYQIGGILAHLLTGKHPDPNAPLAILDRVPDVRAMGPAGETLHLVDVIRKARDLDPARRYQTAQEMLDALTPFLPVERAPKPEVPPSAPVEQQ